MSRPATFKYRQLLDAAAVQVDLPQWTYRGQAFRGGEWLEGLVLGESAGNPKARRYEPHQDRALRRDAPTDADRPDIDDGMLEDDASYGLMQVMGYNARQLVGVTRGVPMTFGWLFLPIVNIAMGLRILAAELHSVRNLGHPAHQLVDRALCRYNGGPTGDAMIGGDFRLRAYVNRVADHTLEVQRDRGRS